MNRLSLLLALVAGPAFADCPDPSLEGPRYLASGPSLLAPQTWAVRAQGAQTAPCADWEREASTPEDLAGFLPVAPTAVFHLSTMSPHIMIVSAQAECRPVLLLRTGDGLWHFGKTTNARQEVTLWGVADGPLQVWIGSATAQGCNGTVTLETFDR